MVSLICGVWKTKQMNQTERLINTEIRRLVTMAGGMGEIGEGDRGTNFKLQNKLFTGMEA